MSEPEDKPPAAAHRAAINAAALNPYSEDQAPELVSRFSSRLDEVETFRQLAAEAAAADPDCQLISMVEVANTSTMDDLRFWVECSDPYNDLTGKIVSVQESCENKCEPCNAESCFTRLPDNWE